MVEAVNNSTRRNCIIAGASALTGATIGGGLSYLYQREVFNNPDQTIKVQTTVANRLKEYAGTFEKPELVNRIKNSLDEALKDQIDFAKAGKFNIKNILKVAGVGGLLASAMTTLFVLLPSWIKNRAEKHSKKEEINNQTSM